MYVVQYSSTNLKRWYQRTQTLANIGPLERPDSSQNSVRDNDQNKDGRRRLWTRGLKLHIL